MNQIANYYYSYAMYAYVGYYIVVSAMLLRKPAGPLTGSKWPLFWAITLAFSSIMTRALFSQSAQFPLMLKQFLWIASTCSELMGMALFLIYCRSIKKLN